MDSAEEMMAPFREHQKMVSEAETYAEENSISRNCRTLGSLVDKQYGNHKGVEINLSKETVLITPQRSDNSLILTLDQAKELLIILHKLFPEVDFGEPTDE